MISDEKWSRVESGGLSNTAKGPTPGRGKGEQDKGPMLWLRVARSPIFFFYERNKSYIKWNEFYAITLGEKANLEYFLFCLVAVFLDLGIFNFFFNVYLFLRERERQSASGGGAEREGVTESEAGSRL